MVAGYGILSGRGGDGKRRGHPHVSGEFCVRCCLWNRVSIHLSRCCAYVSIWRVDWALEENSYQQDSSF